MSRKPILSSKDVDSIRRALLRWGKPASAVSMYTEKMLLQQIEIWKNVVHYSWTADHGEKYEQDIAVRYWIQIAMEHSGVEASGQIEDLVAPHDQHFRRIMKPVRPPRRTSKAPLSGHPYFWEENSILPEA